MSEIPLEDRTAGALLGLALSDALGITLEFKSPGTFKPIGELVGGGSFSRQRILDAPGPGGPGRGRAHGRGRERAPPAKVLWTEGGYESPLMWGLLALAIFLRGGGAWSLDRKLGLRL